MTAADARAGTIPGMRRTDFGLRAKRGRRSSSLAIRRVHRLSLFITAERELRIEISGQPVVPLTHAGAIRLASGEIAVMAGGEAGLFAVDDPFGEDDSAAASADRLLAPMPGKIVRVFARAGERVKRGQPLVVLEAMKMENTLVAPADAEIAALDVAAGDQVDERRCCRALCAATGRRRLMTLHLIKLCVGVESLEIWRVGRGPHGCDSKKKGQARTRSRDPADAEAFEELLDGGSLYWVIKGQIAARQRFLDIRPARSKDGVPRCGLVYEPKLVPTLRRAHRPFQGWRYLDTKAAPPDASTLTGAKGLPPQLRAELAELGLL